MKKIVLIVILLIYVLGCDNNKSMIEKLTEFKTELKDIEFPHNNIDFTNEILIESVDELIDSISVNTSSNLEEIFIKKYHKNEEIGWKLCGTQKVINYWEKLGEILKIENVYEKLNLIGNKNKVNQIIKELQKFRNSFVKELEIPTIESDNYRDPREPIDYDRVKYYEQMIGILNEAIDNIQSTVINENKTDEFLFVFEKELDKILSNKVITNNEWDIGFDTFAGDVEYIGGFFEKIMDILGIKYSRGLLSEKLNTF